MTFDANNRLVDYDDGTTTTEFVYDADGNRILRLGTDDTTYIGGIYETNGTVETAYYTFAGETVAMRTKDTASDKRYWLITDRLGSTINTVDATNTSNVSTHLYYPFGQERGTTAGSGTDRMYTGQVSDAADTGLLFYNARYYDPALRLFTAADTIIPDPANPQTFNRYAYVNNNPIRFADPSGHETCDLETGVCWSDTDYSAQSRLTQQCRCNVTTNMYGTYWSNIPVGDDGFPLRNGIPDGVIIQPPNGDGAGHRAYDHSDLAKGSMSWLPEMILTLVAGEALALLTGQIARPFVTRLVTRSIQRSASNATSVAGRLTRGSNGLFGSNPTALKPRTSGGFVRDAGREVQVFQTELSGGSSAAERFFASQTGVVPSSAVQTIEANGLRYTIRPSGHGAPTVEVFDALAATVEKIRFVSGSS